MRGREDKARESGEGCPRGNLMMSSESTNGSRRGGISNPASGGCHGVPLRNPKPSPSQKVLGLALHQSAPEAGFRLRAAIAPGLLLYAATKSWA